MEFNYLPPWASQVEPKLSSGMTIHINIFMNKHIYNVHTLLIL